MLHDNGISYDSPLTPIEVAQIRAERINKEKEQLAQKATAAAAASQSNKTAVAAAVIVTQAQTSVVATQSGTAQAQLTVVPATQLQSVVSVGSAGSVVSKSP